MPDEETGEPAGCFCEHSEELSEVLKQLVLAVEESHIARGIFGSSIGHPLARAKATLQAYALHKR